DHALWDRAVLERPGEPVCLLMATLVAKAAIAVPMTGAMPDMAAGQWLGLAVVGDALGERPAGMAVVPLLRGNDRDASVTPARRILEPGLNPLFWSLELRASR